MRQPGQRLSCSCRSSALRPSLYILTGRSRRQQAQRPSVLALSQLSPAASSPGQRSCSRGRHLQRRSTAPLPRTPGACTATGCTVSMTWLACTRQALTQGRLQPGPDLQRRTARPSGSQLGAHLQETPCQPCSVFYRRVLLSWPSLVMADGAAEEKLSHSLPLLEHIMWPTLLWPFHVRPDTEQAQLIKIT